MQLLRQIQARLPGLDHVDDAAKMPLGALQPLDDFGVRLVEMRLGPVFSYPPG